MFHKRGPAAAEHRLLYSSLLYSIVSVILCLAVLAKHQVVVNRLTDRQTDRHTATANTVLA